MVAGSSFNQDVAVIEAQVLTRMSLPLMHKKRLVAYIGGGAARQRCIPGVKTRQWDAVPVRGEFSMQRTGRWFACSQRHGIVDRKQS